MASVTLTGIKRRGLMAWKARKWWVDKRVRIWSREHYAWWRPNAYGYTIREEEAGVWNFPDAYDSTKHCGPEKKIMYYTV